MPPLRLLRPDGRSFVAMDAMDRVRARIEADNRVVMVRVKLTDLDVGYTKNKGFERREPSERRINTFVKTYQHTDDAEKTIMIVRAATTTPLLLAGAMIRLRDSFLFFAPNMSHRNNLTQSGRPMLQIYVAQARLELVFFGGGPHSRPKHGNNLARGATGARDLCLVPVCCGVVPRCPSNWGPPRAKDVFEETGLGCNRSRNERISMKLVWRLAKQRSANVKARRSPRRSLNVVGWLSVVSGRLLRLRPHRLLRPHRPYCRMDSLQWTS